MPPEIKFTAIVVACNEGVQLSRSLPSLRFCDELIVVDLGSTDNTPIVAQSHGAQVLHHPRVPFGQLALPDALPRASNDWIINADPDEVYPAEMRDSLKQAIAQGDDVGLIAVPFQFYFKERRLDHGIWGGVNYLPKVFRRDAVEVAAHPHSAVRLKPGFRSLILEGNRDHAVKHYWVASWRQMFEKHWRYIRQEGVARYADGERFSWPGFARKTLKAFKHGLIDRQGSHDGLLGIALCVFYCWYVAMCQLSLRRYEAARKSPPSHERCKDAQA